MKKKNFVLKEIGKVAINLGYLSFTSLVLGSIIKGGYDRLLLLAVGGSVAALLIAGGIFMLTGGEE